MAALTVVREDDRREEALVLKHGRHVDPEVMFEPGHSAQFEAEMAFRWSPPLSYTRHRDVVWVDAGGEGRIKAVEVAYRGSEKKLILAGITHGRRVPHMVGSDLTQLEFEEGEGAYRLLPGALSALSNLTFTWYGGRRAKATTFSREEGRDAVLGSSLPTGAFGEDPSVGEPETRSLSGRTYLTAFLPIGTGEGDVLESAILLPGAEDVEVVTTGALYALLALLLLAVLLLFGDVLRRLARLRTKLTLGFGVAALVPLLLFFFGLSGILEREVGRTESSTLIEQVGQVKARLDELRREDVPRRARALLEDEELTRALTATYDGEEGADTAFREIEAFSSPLKGPARVFVEDAFPHEGDPGPRVFPAAVRGQDHPFLRIPEPENDIAYRWSRIVIQGVASKPVAEGRRTLVLEVDVDQDLITELKSRFGGRFELLLFSLRGYPHAGTLELFGEQGEGRMRLRREAVAKIDLDRAPAIRKEILAGARYSVAYDLVRTSRGAPVALMGVALPRREFIAARAEIRNLFLVIGAVILVLEVIVGNILTRRITDPLTSLARGARAVARGKLMTRVEVTGSDELGNLTDSFNRMTAELGRRIGELSKLNEAIRAFSGSLERELVLERAVDAFREVASAPEGLVIALGHEEEAEVAAGLRGGRPITGARLSAAVLGGGIVSRALALASPEVWSDLSGDSLASGERDILGTPRSAAAVPFRPSRETPGAVILLYDRADPGLSAGDLQFLSTLAQQVGIALENARLYQLAIEDPATGLYIHSYFLARLREETDRALDGDRPLSVVLVSLEELPGIYETYGTEEGDHVLGQVIRRLRTALRGMHIMARADRETVEILLPEVGKDAALHVAQAIRDALARSILLLAGDPSRTFRLTPSIGLATCPDDARSAEFLLSEAQQALFKAVTDREGGRLVDVGRERESVQAEVRGRGGRYVFRSEKMMELLETTDRIAASNVPILLQGETGVGKEVVAEIVHEKSGRRGKPLVKVNCAALPETLLESELFGHERGAFTGAERRKPGRFELAHRGTLFLDEIGEIPPQTQVKLLRVLQDHTIERLGGTTPIQVDVRVITATNLDLLAAIREGRFREDLYFRLNVVSLVVPPLRARREEIPDLVDHFLESYRRTQRTTGERLSPAAMDRLFSHDWPGNVRELRNTIERALVIARNPEVQADEIVFPEPAEERARPAPTAAVRLPAPTSDGELASLNPRQRKLMEILARRESITNKEYADLVGVSARTGNRDLRELIERGLIVQIGRRRAAIYRLPE
ncbi:MAG: sigma 54-interacting transcriptional regulator [Planctomycetota bacterium]